MRTIIIFLLALVFSMGFSSCKGTASVYKQHEVAGYTLKGKKELMRQKILNNRPKKVLTLP